MSTRRKIVHTHIEKTAGTSLLQFFEQTVGKKNIAFYDPVTDSIIRVSDLGVSPANNIIDKLQLKSYAFWPVAKQLYFQFRTNKRHTKTIPDTIAIVHGHFLANRFDTVLPDAIRTIVIRNPLKRMQSHYDHWKRAKGRNQWRVMVPYSSDMSFEKFALLPEMQNYQTQALAGKKLESFDLVGVTQRMDAFTQAFYDLLAKEGYIEENKKQKKVEQLNTHTKVYKPTSAFEKAFQAFHQKDFELYEKAQALAV